MRYISSILPLLLSPLEPSAGSHETGASALMDEGQSPSKIVGKIIDETNNDPKAPSLTMTPEQFQEAINKAVAAVAGVQAKQVQQLQREADQLKRDLAVKSYYRHTIGGFQGLKPSEDDVRIETDSTGHTILWTPFHINAAPRKGDPYAVRCFEGGQPLLRSGRQVYKARRDLIIAETFINESIQTVPIGTGPTPEQSTFRASGRVNILSTYNTVPMTDAFRKAFPAFCKANPMCLFIDEPVSISSEEVQARSDRRESSTQLSSTNDHTNSDETPTAGDLNGSSTAPPSSLELQAAGQLSLEKGISKDAALTEILDMRSNPLIAEEAL